MGVPAALPDVGVVRDPSAVGRVLGDHVRLAVVCGDPRQVAAGGVHGEDVVYRVPFGGLADLGAEHDPCAVWAEHGVVYRQQLLVMAAEQRRVPAVAIHRVEVEGAGVPLRVYVEDPARGVEREARVGVDVPRLCERQLGLA